MILGITEIMLCTSISGFVLTEIIRVLYQALYLDPLIGGKLLAESCPVFTYILMSQIN